MDTNQILLLLFVFGAVAMLAFTVMGIFAPKPVQDRLKQVAGRDLDRERIQTDWQHKLVELIGPLGKIALPQEGWENSPLRHRFMHAGFRGQSAPLLFFGIKTLLTIALPGLFMLYTGLTTVSLSFNSLLMGLLALAALGYYLPNIYLSRRIASRQRDIFEGFPDAIDLMMVCVEAGLGIDAAINRVASEIGLKSPLLAEEFHLVSLELRAGATRERALRNLALRTGVEEVDLLVSMLVQADRFGTSIADSLRVHADSLRTKRRQRAEEAAAKIPLKLLFPLIFCIFPSLLLVLLGPAFISIYRVLLPTLAGQ